MSRLRILLASATLAIAASGTPAIGQQCPAPGYSSLHAGLMTSNIAFIGTVISADSEAVVFKVEHGIRESKTGDKISFPRSNPSACTHSFVLGERWLYAGHGTETPTMKLGPAGSDARDRVGPFSRLADESAHLPKAWQDCSDDEQCIAIPFGCSASAANTALASLAAKQTRRVADELKLMQCPGADKAVLPKAMCVQSRCGAWTAPAR